MVYLGLRKTDIYQNNKTKVKFNPVKTEANSTGDEFLIISNIETKELVKVTVSDFRANYSLLKSGSLSENSFFI